MRINMNENKQYRGIFFLILSAFCFSLMGLFVRLSGDLPTMEKAFFRNFVAAVVAVVILCREKQGLRFERKNGLLLLARSVCGTIGIFGNFYAIDRLILSDANMLNKMAPFFTLLFSALLLKEKLRPYQAGAVAAAFIGSMFILKPSLSNVALVPALAGFIGGMGAGMAYTCVRALGLRGERSSVIIFMFSMFSCLVCFAAMVPVFVRPDLFQFLMLCMAGISAAGGQFAVTTAYFYAPAREISVYDYSAVLFSAIWGFAFFEQIPDWMSVAGYAIICGAAIYNFRKNAAQHQIVKG